MHVHDAETRAFESIGVRIPVIYLPAATVDLSRWAVVACDQFTSQPDYWKQVEEIVGDQPSTLHLTLPEIYLGKPGENERIQSIQAAMRTYIEKGVLEPQEGILYVERRIGDKVRKGLVLCLDLERYDYNKGSQSLIRATEGTIVERLPPRMKIREGAVLELPHILVLIDDPLHTVIEPVGAAKEQLVKRYDFELMLGSGHLTGYQVTDATLEARIIQGLEALAQPQAFQQKYAVSSEQAVLLFAMGDGNHSLATAKAIWEKLKPQVGMQHPARYALVEIENVHDDGLEFEPIHRVVFGLKHNLFTLLRQYFGEEVVVKPVSDRDEAVKIVETAYTDKQVIGLTYEGQFAVVEISHPRSNLAVGTLQVFLDELMKTGQAEALDYIHGLDVVCELSSTPNNFGFFLPKMDKSDLFKTVILDGALPRKTFSMGEAHEKRFYMESRRID